MKGNQFKTTKNESYGYEPKENARYNRIRGLYKVKEQRQRDLFTEIFKNDNYKKLKQYRTIIINAFEHDTNVIRFSEKYSEWFINTMVKNESYMCFYYVRKELELKGVKISIPSEFQDFYNKMERINKIETLKNNIKNN